MVAEEAAGQLRPRPSSLLTREPTLAAKGHPGAILVAVVTSVVRTGGGVPFAGQAVAVPATGTPIVTQKAKAHGEDAVHAVTLHGGPRLSNAPIPGTGAPYLAVPAVAGSTTVPAAPARAAAASPVQGTQGVARHVAVVPAGPGGPFAVAPEAGEAVAPSARARTSEGETPPFTVHVSPAVVAVVHAA